MIVFYLTIIVVLILGTLDYHASIINVLNYDEFGNWERKNNTMYYFFLILVFFIVGGCRYKVGADYMSYFMGYKESLQTILHRLITFDEPGLPFITFICRKIWDEGAFVIFVENAVIVLLVFRGIKKSGVDSYSIPLLLYIFYCGWLFSFNGIRQAMAVSIIFAFSTSSNKHWFFKFVIVVLGAGLFHKSALFIFPFLLIAKRRLSISQLLLIGSSSVVISRYANSFLMFMGTSMETTNEYLVREINPIRVVVSFAPLLLIAILWAYRDLDFFELNSFESNMVIINALVTLLTANSAYMNRFSRFTVLYTMVFIPKFTDRFTDVSKKIVNVIIIGLYFFYFVYEVKNAGSYLPFQWSFYHFGEY